MSDHILWRKSYLYIPEENLEKALEALLKITHHEGLKLDGHSPTEKVIRLLEEKGYLTGPCENGISITYDIWDDTEIGSDSLFPALVGIVQAGSHITTHDDFGT